MRLRKTNHNQQGMALILAISIALVLIMMGYLIFALSHTALSLGKSRKDHLQNKIAVHQAFRNASVNQAFLYNQNTIPSANSGSVLFNSGSSYTFEVTNNHIQSTDNQRFGSFIVPENGYTMRTIDYYLRISYDKFSKNMTIRVPSTTHRSPNSINKTTISLNIPAINFDNILATQLDSVNATLAETGVGHIGDLSIDNNSYVLTFTNTQGVASTLDLSGTFSSGNLSLAQGWRLNNGSWELLIGVYDADSEKACVIASTLQNFEASFSNLSCAIIDSSGGSIEQLFARYPNPQGYSRCIEYGNYQEGAICLEHGILFQALKQKGKVKVINTLPFQDPSKWQVYYPTADWVSPFTDKVIYQKNDQVVYGGKLFVNTQKDQTSSPLEPNSGWEINGVYNFDDRVFYDRNKVVIFNNEFYEAINDNQGSVNPSVDLTNWRLLGSDYENIPASGYPSYGIEFPYRQDLNVMDPQDLLYLRCTGEYPQIDTTTYAQCEDGKIYNFGDTCYENNILFVAQYYTTQSPANNSGAWRPVMPSLNWVIPYSNNITYGDSITRVFFDGMVFVNNGWVAEGQTPYETGGWDIDGIYDWNTDITYKTGNIVMAESNFYRAKWYHNGVNPLTSGQWGAWEDLGTRYEGQIVDYFRDLCNGIIRAPIIEKGSCDRFNCVINITTQSSGGTGIYTYNFYDENDDLVMSTPVQNSVTVDFDTAGSHSIYVIAQDSDGVTSLPSVSLSYTLESQLSTDRISYETPNSLSSSKSGSLSNGMAYTTSGDNIRFTCPSGYAFLKVAYSLKNRKSKTYYTDDGQTYMTLWANADRSGGLRVRSYSGSYSQGRARYNNNTGKAFSRLTRATCVPMESDGHWDV
ncbi:hypothetical protein [Francisella sp. SYW-9]|uniref:hypothetical protein n=1 Tax=Francisella sp. SYW-9 TaxID=2610888 RepID=UPI00123D39E5|nr:hypothetical protein [Francisella sp. SYW-9]